jgi:hypothetical protein
LWRWITRGVETPDGRVVKLRAVVFVGAYYLSAEHARDFIREQQPEGGRRNLRA